MLKLGLGIALLVPVAAVAQDYRNDNIIVSATRSGSKYYKAQQPVIGLRRRADFAAQPVAITSDSRDEKTRREEVYGMMLIAIDRAKDSGIDLVYGDNELRTITRENYRDLLILRGNRTDTSEIQFFAQRSLAQSAADADMVITRYIKSVGAQGRSLMEKRGDLALTIVGPDQYRDQIIQLIAAEANKNAGFFGPGYAMEVQGLHQELAWTQVNASDVFLYIPYNFKVVPR
jgi:hypothetical protein